MLTVIRAAIMWSAIIVVQLNDLINRSN